MSANENEPLLNSDNSNSKSNSTSYSTSNSKSNSKSNSTRGIIINRLLLLVFLCSYSTTTIYQSYQTNTIKSKTLSEQKSQIQALEKEIEKQSVIIKRFNSSITNTDVIKRVDLLQKELHNVESSMQDELLETERRVDEKLSTTASQLSETVSQAQTEISDEVNKVHTDVESYMRSTQDQFSMENNFMVYQLAGTFTLLSMLISMWHMTSHLRHFNQPDIQRKILAILWMSPIYAMTSWLSLVFSRTEGYLAIIKDSYEAYVIYTFLSFLISVLGKGNREAVIELLVKHADHLPDPRVLGYCCRMNYETAKQKCELVLLQCQTFAMQFVFFKPTISILKVLCDKMSWHGFGSAESSDLDYRTPQFYFMLVENTSIFFAFSGLLKFFHAVHSDLEWCKPWPKFLCIKGVVFMTFWQGLVLDILANTTQDFGGQQVNADQWAQNAQNFLICLEMLLFSIAHFYVFPTEEWKPGYRPTKEKTQFADSMALNDFVSDLKLVLRGSNSKKRKKKKVSAVVESNDVEKVVDELETIIEQSSVDTNSIISIQTVDSTESDNESTGYTEMQRAASRILQSGVLQRTNSDQAEEIEDIWKQGHDVTVEQEKEENIGENTKLLRSNNDIESNIDMNESKEHLRPSLFTTLGA